MSILKRREFLALAAQSMGMYALSNIYRGLPAHAQSVATKKRVVFVYFYHGAIIRPPVYNGGAVTHDKGNWTFDKPLFGGRNGALAALNQVRGDSRIIRGISQKFDLNKDNDHVQSQSSVFSGCAMDPTKNDDRSAITGNYKGKTIDVLMGQHLQRVHGSRAPYLIVGSEADQPSNDKTPQWITSSYEDFRNYIRPFTNLNQLKETLLNDVSCFASSQGTVQQQASVLSAQRSVQSIIKRNIERFSKERLISAKIKTKMIEQIDENKSNLDKKIANLTSEQSSSTIENCTAELPSDSELTSYGNFRKHDIPLFTNRNRAINKMVSFALANNYTNVATIYHNNFSTRYHDAAHESGFNKNQDSYRQKLRENIDLSIGLVNDLINQLKAQNIYQDTMIVLATEFSSQGDNHNLNNMPWLVINSGSSGDYDPRQRIHIGDLHTSLARKVGLTLNGFGGTEHVLKRTGQFNGSLLG